MPLMELDTSTIEEGVLMMDEREKAISTRLSGCIGSANISLATSLSSDLAFSEFRPRFGVSE